MTLVHAVLSTVRDLADLALSQLREPRVVFTRARVGRLTLTGELTMLLLTNAQKVSLSIQPVDAFGQPARVDGVPAWAVSDDTLATITPATDGLSAVVEPIGPVGTVQVQVTADADLGGGVRSISGTLDVQIEASEAVSLTIVAGAPEPK